MIDLQPAAGPALVVGGGRIAARKVRALLEAGFEVVVVAPEVCAEILREPVHTCVRPFAENDIGPARFAVVFACTSVREVNRRVGELARAAGIAVAVTDAAGECTFTTPATLREGTFTVAVSTSGASPRAAKEMRDRIAETVSGAGAAAPWLPP
jgi:siroheme synthase-like protein